MRNSRYSRFGKWATTAGAVAVAVGAYALAPSAATAQTKQLRIPTDICEILKRKPLAPALVQRIQARTDFVRILQLVDETCPDLAGPLLQTASIPVVPSPDGDGGAGPGGDGTGGDGTGGDGTGGGDTGGGDTGGGDTGGGDTGGGDTGGETGGTGGNGNSSSTNGNSGSSSGQGGSTSTGNQGKK